MSGVWRVVSRLPLVRAVLFLLVAVSVHAQPPGIPGLAADDRRGDQAVSQVLPGSSPEDARTELQRKLDDTQAWHERLDEENAKAEAPIGIPAEEIAEKRRLVETLGFLYRAEINRLDAIRVERQVLDAIEARAHGWRKFDQPPPFSILMLDDLLDAADAVAGKVAALASSEALIKQDIERRQREVGRAETATRLAAEAVEKAKAPLAQEQAKWRLDIAQLSLRVASRFLAANTSAADLTRAKLATANAELALLNRQIAEVARDTVFTETDLEKMREAYAVSGKKIQQELEVAQQRAATQLRKRDEAQRELDKARSDGHAGALQPQEVAVLAATAQLSSAEYETEVLTNLSVLTKYALGLSEDRYSLVNNSDAGKRQEALSRLRIALQRLQPWGAYVRDALVLDRSEERKQIARLASLDNSATTYGFEQEILDAYKKRKETTERLQSAVERVEHSLRRWLGAHKNNFWDYSFDERLAEHWAAVTDFARGVWEFELFTLDETTDIEGRAVITQRAVTFGKMIDALLLFVGGYWFCAVLARHVQRILVGRFDIQNSQANVLRRWFVTAVTIILLLFVLNFVRIPLTAFAFLGGALAIGAGFGTQTLIKNLICGVMILFERKIKVGDIVELDGIVGTVTEIDIRSSTVRGFDGVETMLPNATFLENKVTNWTYTTRKLRRTVKIGVVYGSPVKRVSEVLLECANRHGLVLDDPAPFVWFEDFGDNSLVFGLYFWLEMGPNVNSSQVMSDLRFMIEKRFAEEGVVVAFPQRDLHLDTPSPLRVELMPSVAAPQEAANKNSQFLP